MKASWKFAWAIASLLHSSLTAALFLGAVAPVLHAAEKVELKPKMLAGQIENSETKISVNQVLTIGGNPIRTAADTAIGVRAEAAKEVKDKSLAVKSSIVSFKTQISLPNGMMKFDSEKPNEIEVPAGLDFLKEAFEVISKLKFTAFLDTEKNRYEKIEIHRSDLNNLNPLAQNMIQDQFNEENIKVAANQEIARFPEGPVAVGDKWKRTEILQLGGGQTFTFETEYIYQGVIESGGMPLHRISAKHLSVKYTIDPNSATPLRVEKSDLKVTESDGEVLFDQKAGKTVKVRTQAVIQGEMTLNIQGTATPATLDLKLEMANLLR